MPARHGVPKGPLPKFIAVDLAVSVAALSLAFLIVFQELRAENINAYIRLMVPILLLRIGALYVFRLYDFSRGLTAFDIIYITAGAMIVAHGIETLAMLFYENYYEPPPIYGPPLENAALDKPEDLIQISRYILALNFLLSWIGAASWRILYLRRRMQWAYDRTRMLIVGAGELAESVYRDIRQYARLGHTVAGMIDDALDRPSESTNVLGRMSDLETVVQTHDIDEIIITSRRANRQELLDIISACHNTPCRVHLLPELYEVTIGKVEIGQVAGVPLITLSSEPWTEWGMFVKRAFDITVSLAGLIVLSPLLALIAIAIRSDDGAPVLYRQERVGKDGRYFIVNKFRTMRVDAEAELGPVLSWDNDPRVTKAGRFLRRWHLDEFPQLINVLKGDMSLVGPRPERPHFVERHKREIPAYRLRERVRPGITGLGQIHGFYNSPVEHKLRYDLAYINNMSFLLDLKILFLTLRVTYLRHGNHNGNGRSSSLADS